MPLSFNEIKNLKKDTKFCECGYGMTVWYELMNNPVEEVNDELHQLKWQGKNAETGEVTDFLITKKYEHYGPKIYLYDAYVASPKM